MGRQPIMTHPIPLPAPFPFSLGAPNPLYPWFRSRGTCVLMAYSHYVVVVPSHVASDVHLKFPSPFPPLPSLPYLLPMLISCIDTYLRTFISRNIMPLYFFKVILENPSTVPCPC